MTPQLADITPVPAAVLQKIVIVNGSEDTLEWLEPSLGSGGYEVFYLDDVREAYSRIRDLGPDMVVLCARIEDADAFQFLTMLKLDAQTRPIPVQTFTTEWEGQVLAEDLPEFAEPEPDERVARRSFSRN